MLTSAVDQCADGAREARQYSIVVCCGRACSACFVLTGASAFQRPHVTQQAVSSRTEMSSSRIRIARRPQFRIYLGVSARHSASADLGRRPVVSISDWQAVALAFAQEPWKQR